MNQRTTHFPQVRLDVGSPEDSRRRSGRRRIAGWTAIELLASLALASLLAAATLGISAQLSRELALVRRDTPVDSWTSIFERQLQREYRACRAVRVSRNELVFEGYASVPGAEGAAHHQPSRIEYRIEPHGGTLFLQRTATSLAGPDGGKSQVTVVAVGVLAFELKSRLETDAPPGILRLAMWLETDRTTPALDAVLVRHGVAP